MKRDTYKILSEQYSRIAAENDKEDILSGLEEIETGFNYTPKKPIARYTFVIDYDEEPGNYEMDQEDAISGEIIKAPAGLTTTGIPYFFDKDGYIYCNHPVVLEVLKNWKNYTDNEEEVEAEYFEIVGNFFNKFFNES
jgi:hypothetical protein